MNAIRKLALLALSLPLAVFGYDGTWTQDGVTFGYTVSGTEACVYITSCGESAEIVIPSEISDGDNVYTVTSIGENAFGSCSGLTSVTIPNSVTSIGNYAFAFCNNLTLVTIPSSVTSIGSSAFYRCSSLTSAAIPDSVTRIGVSAFDSSSLIDTTTIKGLKLVDGWIVGYNADCQGDLTLENVRGIADGAFRNCSGLTSVTIPDSVTSIGGGAFKGCQGLAEEDFVIVKDVLYDYVGDNAVVMIPDGVTSISEDAFRGCSSLTSVTIPNGVTSIGGSAFSGCSSLTSVTMPNSVTSIGNYAFFICSGLESVTMPSDVTSIGNRAFDGCSSLESVTIPECVLGKLSTTFPDSTNLQHVEIADGVESIGEKAFYGCSGLTSVAIPSSVTSIGDYAFYYCSGLTSVTIPSSVTSIGKNAFYYCSGLTSVTIPSSVTSISDYAFAGCSSLTSVTIPPSVTSIGSFAFVSCTSLESVTIPGSVTSIGSFAFVSCTSLESVTIPGSVTSISDYAFYRCSGLTSVLIPNSVTSIGYHTFNSTALKTVFVDLGYTEQVKEVLQKNDRDINVSKLEFIEVERPPEIRTVEVTPIAPFGLAIDYTVADVMAGAESYTPEVKLTVGELTYTAKTLSGDISATKGSHRLYWNLAADGIESFTEGTISVAFVKAPYCVIDLSGGKDADSYPVTYLACEPEGGFNTDEYKKDKLVLKRVDAGSFIMGEDQSVTDHKVTLTKPFYMALFETTQKQWELVTGANPSCFQPSVPEVRSDDDTSKRPVETVSYNMIRGSSKGANWPTDNEVDADSFLGKLRARTGNLAFDLPTEAQWEYACRAGTMTTYNLGDEKSDLANAGWYDANSTNTTHDVGGKAPNAWGLYDMHGNVLEWCLDWYGDLDYGSDPKGPSEGSSEDPFRVMRGGAWGDDAVYCTSSYRIDISSSWVSYDIGFRLSRTLSTTPVTPATATDVSATVLTDGSKVSDTQTIDCAPFDGATVTVTVNGAAVEPTDGSYAWLPSKVGENEIVYTIDGNTFTVSYDAVERAPVITDVAVTKVAPFGVAIDYTYTMMENATTAYTPVITATTLGVNATAYTAKTLSAPQSLGENKYRVYWNMAKDGVPSLAGATVSVTLKEKLSDYCVVDLSTYAETLAYNVTWTDNVPEGGYNTDDYKKTKLVLKRIDAGEFIMGEEQDKEEHKVTLTKPFYMALFETTQEQWQRVTGANPSYFQPGDYYPVSANSDKNPVERVSYNVIRGSIEGAKWPASNAVDDGSFLGILRARTGNLAFDLPTEAQWEYACRAGTTTTFSFDETVAGVDAYMWYEDNAGLSTSDTGPHEVGKKNPNPWGLYDMHGNVWELCLDWFGDLAYGCDPAGAAFSDYSGRVMRGGSFDLPANYSASYLRLEAYPGDDPSDQGFRLALPVEQKSSNTLKFDNVTTSVIADGETVTDAITLEAMPFEGEVATVTADGDTMLEAEDEAKSATYRPTVNGAHTIEYVVYASGRLSVAMSVTYNFNLPPLTVSDVSVQKIEPFGLAIDYTVDNVMAGAEGYVPEVTLTLSDGITKYTATTLSEPQSLGDNKYRLYWNMAKDGIASFEGATVSVTYKEENKVLIDEPTTVAGDGAKYCVIDLTEGSGAESYPLTFLNEEPEGGFNTDEYKTNKLVLKRIDAGSFVMGSDQENTDHTVTLTKPFYMALFETTQRQWELVTGSNPCSSSGYGKGDAYPVYYVSYNDIRGSDVGAKWPSSNAVDSASFLGKLRARTGLNIDLPAAAQWEYACRAETTTAYSYGNSADETYMWYNGNASSTMRKVGTKSPNPWGFYDMHGNVWEWCLDWYGDLDYGTDPKGPSEGLPEDPSRVMRGGSWVDDAANCSSSSQNWSLPVYGYCDAGFRLSRTITATPVTPATSSSVSATVLTNGSKVSEEVTIDCAPFEGADVTVTVNGDDVDTSSGSYAWLPSKVGENKIVYTITDANNHTATFTVAYDAVERAPVITDVAVTKVAPFGVAIDYTYTTMEGATTTYSPVITATTADGATVYTAKTLSAPQSLGENKYRVYWNMAKDGVPSLAGATVSVTLKEKLPDYCVVDLPEYTAEAVSSYNVTWTDNVPEGGYNTDDYKKTKLVLKRIDAGEFIIGEEQDKEEHKVTLTKPFYMALFETTQSQWQRVTGTNPSQFSEDGEMKPVEKVSYDMIRGSVAVAKWPTDNKVDDESFLGKLRARTGNLAFDLPTEAQWEYACRAGTTTKWNFGKDDSIADSYMWYAGNAGMANGPQEVGGKKPNAWGLYDMHGNVMEWCLDWHGNLAYGLDPVGSETGDYRVLRGGSHIDDAISCTSFIRYSHVSSVEFADFGFRLALPVEQKSSNVYEVNNVTTSVIADGATVTEAIDFGYLGEEGAPVTITAGLVGATDRDFVVENKTTEDTQSWQPTKPGDYEYEYIVGGATVLSATYKMWDIPMSFSETTLASFNYSGVYDGEAHGIALTTGCDALADIKGATITYLDEADVDYEESYPTFKNASINNVSYRIKANGYATFRGKATVEITPRPVTLQSDTKTDFVYDGSAHEFPVLVKSGNWFVAGEGIATSDWATVTNVDDGDEGVVANTFDYEPIEGTDLNNYDITVKYGTISVQPLDISGEGEWVYQLNEDHIYDGNEWTQTVKSATFNELPVTFDLTDNKQTNAGTYQMTLTGTGNFTGSRKIEWSIGRRKLELTAASDEKVYDGTALKADYVRSHGFVLDEGAGYVLNSSRTGYGESENTIDTIRWNDNTLESNYEVTKNPGKLTIKKRPVTITSESNINLVYNGKDQTYEVITIGGDGFVAGEGIVTSDWATVTTVAQGERENTFTYEAEDGTELENYEITVVNGTIKVVPKELTEAMFSLVGIPEDGYVYDGMEKKPEVSCQDGEHSIIGNDDYSVAYADNVEVGYATVTITGKNNYKGTVKLYFTIGKAITDVTFDALGGKMGSEITVVLEQENRRYNNFPADPTRDGYTFSGWYLNMKDDAPQATADGKCLEPDDHTLYARWEPNSEMTTEAFAYKDNDDGTITITGFATEPTSKISLVIPDTIDGKPVTEIAEKAFVGSGNIASVTLPIFLERIGRRAFHNATSLKVLNIPAVRDWEYPNESGSLIIGEYAFANTLLGEVYLPEEVTEIGNSAFNGCQKLATVTILGAPSVGKEAFYNAGIAAGKSPTLRLDPKLAANETYLSKLTANFGNANLPAAVRTDAVVESVAPKGISIASDESVEEPIVELPVTIDLASTWGEVDTDKVFVEYSDNLEGLTGDPQLLTPKDVIKLNEDGSFLISVPVSKEATSGFFRVKILK